MKDLRQVIQRPVVTEKSTIDREQRNVVTFAVHPDANKHDIRRAVDRFRLGRNLGGPDGIGEVLGGLPDGPECLVARRDHEIVADLREAAVAVRLQAQATGCRTELFGQGHTVRAGGLADCVEHDEHVLNHGGRPMSAD